MFRKILYPTDFSKDAEKALEYVKKLKEAGTEEVVILHVIDGESLEAMVTPCIWEGKDIEKCEEQIKRKMKREARKKLKDVGKEIDVNVKIIMRIGKPSAEIIEAAEKEKVSLIVMGAHGMGRMEELLLGSTAEKVTRHAKVPVLVVRYPWQKF